MPSTGAVERDWRWVQIIKFEVVCARGPYLQAQWNISPDQRSRKIMRAEERVVRKRRGRPATGKTQYRPFDFRPKCVKMWTPGRQNNPMSRAAPKRFVGLSSWGSRVLNGLGPELGKLRSVRTPGQEIDRLGDPSATDGDRQLRKRRPQGTERVPRYSQRREDYALNRARPPRPRELPIRSPMYAPSCTP